MKDEKKREIEPSFFCLSFLCILMKNTEKGRERKEEKKDYLREREWLQREGSERRDRRRGREEEG